jgi:hypothetical protein
MMHRESLAAKELRAELSEVMDTVNKTVNYIKTRPFKNWHLQNFARKWLHSIGYSRFIVILVGCQEESLWLRFTTCEE